MTIKELKHHLSLFPNSLEVKIECDGTERDLTRVTCCYPPAAKQYAVLFAEDKIDLREVARKSCESMYASYYDDTPYHVSGRCNDGPEPVITKERMHQAQETAIKFSFDRR